MKHKSILKNKIVYISGIPFYNRPAFVDAERFIRAHFAVMAILNPAILPDGLRYDQYMQICIELVDVCDALVFLPGSQESPGAKKEIQRALYQDKGIIGYTDLKDIINGA